MTDFTIFPTVGSIAQKAVLRATLDMTVRAVSELMDQQNVSSVLLEKNNEHYVFSVEDLIEHLQSGKSYLATLAEVKINKISCILESEHILAAMEAIEQSGQRYLGVLDSNDFLIGILTYTDILSAVDPTILVQKKTIGELVTRTEPITFTADWILEDVLSHLRKLEDSIIIVESGVPIGIITTKDIFKIISTGQTTDKPLSEYMASPVITTCISSTIHEALAQLKRYRIKRAIVVNKANQLVGLVTQSELVGFAYGTWIELVKHHAGELKELVGILEAKAAGFEQMSNKDPLTGLGNRLKLDNRLKAEMERVHRYRAPSFSMILINMDNYERINAQFGRLQANEIINNISLKLIELAACNDDVARTDDNTWAVLLPYTPVTTAAEIAGKLSSAIEKLPLKDFKVNLSLGVGQYYPEESAAAFYDRVCKALVCAKNQDRSQVVIDFARFTIQETC